MQEHPQEKNKKRFLLLSILLHVLLLYLFFYFLSYQKSDKSVAIAPIFPQKELDKALSLAQKQVTAREKLSEKPKEKEQEKDEPAQMIARQSAFGAPVIFADMPESIPTVASNELEDAKGEAPDQSQEPSARHEPEQKEQESSYAKAPDFVKTPSDRPADRELAQAQPQEQKHKTPQVALEEAPIALAHKTEQHIDQKKLLEETIEALENKEPQKAKRATTKQSIEKIAKSSSPKAKSTQARNEGNSQRSVGPTNKKFTFADLANGFMENLQSGGQDLINQRGNPNKRPSIEQLKQASYKQKMAWSLQAAFKRAARRTTFILPAPLENKLECVFYISKEGELEKLEVVSSTGHQELDSYIVKTIKDAFPLPPIPEHWQKDMLVQQWVFRNIQPCESVPYTVNF